MLMHRPQTPQPGFGSITLLQKFTPHFKILDPHLSTPDCLPFVIKCIFLLSRILYLLLSFLIIFLSLDSFTFFGLDLK